MRAARASGACGAGPIAWHATVRGMTFKHIPLTTLLMTAAISVATMVFYFRARRHKAAGFEL